MKDPPSSASFSLSHTPYPQQVSVLGLDKLSRVLGALQQTVPILVDGMVRIYTCFASVFFSVAVFDDGGGPHHLNNNTRGIDNHTSILL